jgi:tetratricopeptide (TPR) repeat protein
MSGLLERVRAALADEYDVERELAGGGMGVVFLGRDRALDRPVAIKVLRPELATAVAAARFVQEGQMLARVQHRAIVTVHRADEEDGVPFMIMELLQGTLADRLSARQVFAADEAIRFCEQLLDGLAQVHAAGIVHRDIKPSNIFIRDDGGPKLGDFGIARRTESRDETLTGPGELPGTPRYMSPEQRVISGVTGASDVYAVGMVLYEMVTGRVWDAHLQDPALGSWDGVPRRLATVLRKALALEADRRPAARAFAQALRNAAAPAIIPRVAVAAGAVILLAILAGIVRPPGPGPQFVPADTSEVALLPFSVEGGDPELGTSLVRATELQLAEGLGKARLAVTPVDQFAKWAAAHVKAESLPPDAWAALRTRAIVQAHASVFSDSVVVTGRVVERDGTIRRLSRPVEGLVTHRGELGCLIAIEVIDAVKPDRRSAFACAPYGNVDAINAYLDGRAAFARDNWRAAEEAFRRSITLDSSKAPARTWWSLYNVCRWGRSCTAQDAQDAGAHLERAYMARLRSARNVGDLDPLLIEAEFAPTVPRRLAIYDTAVQAFGYDAYPKLLLGNELFSRGPLFGLGLDSAVAALNAAATENPGMSPVYEMLAWAEIRLGHAQEAVSALHGYVEAGGQEVDDLLRLAILERFGSDAEKRRGGEELTAHPENLLAVKTMLRLALAFGVPEAQLKFGTAVASMPDAGDRFQGLTAQSLALLALGQVGSAFDALASAARAAGDPDTTREMTFQGLEWAVALPALHLPGSYDERRADAARATLADIRDGTRGARAGWVLLLDALAAGDDAAARKHAETVRAIGALPFLTRLSDALLAAAHGDTAMALRVTNSLRSSVDSHHGIADPLVRVALYLNRGRWLAQRESAAAADAAWRWYEAADWPGTWPSGPPKAGELDWAFETYARYLRAQLAHAHRDTVLVCAVAPDAKERWRNADSAYQSLRDSLLAWTAACGSS